MEKIGVYLIILFSVLFLTVYDFYKVKKEYDKLKADHDRLKDELKYLQQENYCLKQMNNID